MTRASSRRTRRHLALGLIAAVILALGVLLVWGAAHLPGPYDWSDDQQGGLGQSSVQLLERLKAPLHIEVYLDKQDHKTRVAIEQFFARYRAYTNNLDIKYIDPVSLPRQQGDTLTGTLKIRYEDRWTYINQVTEAAMGTALSRLLRQDQPWLVFAEGHGERSIHDSAPDSYTRLAKILAGQGLNVQSLDLDSVPGVPDNTAVLILSQPRFRYDSEQAQKIVRYVQAGGALFWLRDGNPPDGLETVAKLLGVDCLPGVLVSAQTVKAGLDNPAYLIVRDFADSGLQMHMAALLPVACGLIQHNTQLTWQTRTLLRSDGLSWNETGDLQDPPLQPEAADEKRGPLPLAFALEHDQSGARAVVVGDGDFMADNFIDNGANLALAQQLIAWLAREPTWQDSETVRAVDVKPILDDHGRFWIRIGFPIVLPLLIALLGLIVLTRRWQRGRGG